MPCQPLCNSCCILASLVEWGQLAQINGFLMWVLAREGMCNDPLLPSWLSSWYCIDHFKSFHKCGLGWHFAISTGDCEILWSWKKTLLRQFTSTHGLQKAVLYLIIISCLLAWHLSKGGGSNNIVVNVLAFICFGLLTPVNLLVILLIGSMIYFAKMILFVNFLHDVIFA